MSSTNGNGKENEKEDEKENEKEDEKENEKENANENTTRRGIGPIGYNRVVSSYALT